MNTGRRSDRGTTLIEILIALVLMGTVIVAGLFGLTATVVAGRVHRDHANAHSWLQSAADILYSAPKTYCDPAQPDDGEAAVRADYDAIVEDIERSKLDRARYLFTFAPFLPVNRPETQFPLRVGDTPLYAANRLGQSHGLRNLYLKDDNLEIL